MSRSAIESFEYLRGGVDSSRLGLAPETLVIGSFEELPARSKYDWYGERRHAAPEYPRILIQCTLDGWGAYTDGNGSTVPVRENQAFIAVIPSKHRYFLPSESPGWSFVYIFILHPYIVSRIIDRRRELPAVIPMSRESPLFARVIRLLDLGRTSADGFSVEQGMFDLLMEYERLAHDILYPSPERDRLLLQVRAYVIANITMRFDVERLAQTADMSRSHYAHHFKSIVGIPPGRYITQIRLEEAARLLADPYMKLETIASATGFADANHFCKVFRRHFHVSPGEFRRRYPRPSQLCQA